MEVFEKSISIKKLMDLIGTDWIRKGKPKNQIQIRDIFYSDGKLNVSYWTDLDTPVPIKGSMSLQNLYDFFLKAEEPVIPKQDSEACKRFVILANQVCHERGGVCNGCIMDGFCSETDLSYIPEDWNIGKIRDWFDAHEG